MHSLLYAQFSRDIDSQRHCLLDKTVSQRLGFQRQQFLRDIDSQSHIFLKIQFLRCIISWIHNFLDTQFPRYIISQIHNFLDTEFPRNMDSQWHCLPETYSGTHKTMQLRRSFVYLRLLLSKYEVYQKLKNQQCTLHTVVSCSWDYLTHKLSRTVVFLIYSFYESHCRFLEASFSR